MPHLIRSRSLFAVVTLSLLGACQSTPKGLEPLDELANSEGLTRVDSRAVDVLYRRPGASLTSYTKLLIKPITVQFAKDWDPNKASSGSALYRMAEIDRERIKSELGEAFLEVFQREMKQGGYPVVSETGADVLEMQAAIVNLRITAPDPSQLTGNVKVYTTDAGEMTLIMQLHDSVTGELLARAIDREEATHEFYNWTTSVSNTADAKLLIDRWATRLRKAFDASRVEEPRSANASPTPST
jgi:Protein of unknown function (DUF3313)